jgi:hypothetical protein
LFIDRTRPASSSPTAPDRQIGHATKEGDVDGPCDEISGGQQTSRPLIDRSLGRLGEKAALAGPSFVE